MSKNLEIRLNALEERVQRFKPVMVYKDIKQRKP